MGILEVQNVNKSFGGLRALLEADSRPSTTQTVTAEVAR